MSGPVSDSAFARWCWLRADAGCDGLEVEDLAAVLAAGPTPFEVRRGCAAATDATLTPAAVELALVVLALSAPADLSEVLGHALSDSAPPPGPRLLVVAFDAVDAAGAEASVRSALSLPRPSLGDTTLLVGAGPPGAFLALLREGLTGASDTDGAVRLGAFIEFLRAAARRAGPVFATHGPLESALVVRRITPPPAFIANPLALAGRVLDGRYRLDARLGGGGMGVVYRGHQLGIERPVAVKVMTARLASDEQSAARFRREARLVSRLRHPNVVTIHDFGTTDDGLSFLVMELIEGRPLGDLLADGPLAPERVVVLGDQLCAALECAHRAGVIHRDLKPDNILVERLPDGREHVRILDFGLARAEGAGGTQLTQDGAVMGTPAYMAPEQVRGAHTDARTDLYQLGALLHHLLAGRPPFEATTPMAVMMQHLRAPPPDLGEVLSTPHGARLGEIVAALLSKAPEDRPADISAVRARWPSGESGSDRPRPESTAAFAATLAPPPAGETSPFASPEAGPIGVVLHAAAAERPMRSVPPPAPPPTTAPAPPPAGPRPRRPARFLGLGIGLLGLGLLAVFGRPSTPREASPAVAPAAAAIASPATTGAVPTAPPTTVATPASTAAVPIPPPTGPSVSPTRAPARTAVVPGRALPVTPARPSAAAPSLDDALEQELRGMRP